MHMLLCRLLPVFFSGLLVSGCGYHLVGQGNGSGAIPADVITLSVEGSAASAAPLVVGLKRQLAGSQSYKVVAAAAVIDRSTHGAIRIEQISERFVPSAYDGAGIATQYRMTLVGHVLLYREGKQVWMSGAILKSGDVFVAGGPSGIEASRKRIREDLVKEWVYAAALRINSGF